MYNDNTKLITNIVEYNMRVDAGYEYMKNQRVAICATARNCGEILGKYTLPQLDKLCTHFKEAYIFIVENDSTDETRRTIHAWPSVHAISYEFKAPFWPGYSRSDIRIMYMSAYRNLYMEVVDEKFKNWDYLIVLDVDLPTISIDGIANSFGYADDWDMISANGRDSKKGHYYDPYAYADHVNYRNFRRHPQTRTAEIIKLQQNLKPGLGLISVRSAFAGLAIYRMEAARHIRYWLKVGYAEHVGFNEVVYNKGYKRLFINPSMWLQK